MPLKTAAGAALLLALLPGAALAVQPDQAPRPRTGPDAPPPPVPDYAEPVAPLVPVPDAAAAVPAPAAAGIVEAVLIDAPDEGPDAVPPRPWQPPIDPGGALALDHRPGEALGAQWVVRQFERNRIQGGPVDRAIALVQLVNRAYLTAGFVNSGLVVPPQRAPDTGLLELRLIHGRLVAPQSGGDPVTVGWADGRSRGLDPAYVRDRMPSARRRPLNAVAVERDFRRLADDPAISTVNAQLRPGALPGEATLALELLPRDPVDLYLTAGNSRSPSVGGERIAAGGLVRNLVAAGDLVSGELGLTEGVEDVSLGYSVPVIDPRTSFAVRGSYNRAAVVDAPLLPLDIRTRDRGLEASLSRRLLDAPLIPAGEGRWSPSRRLSVGLGLAWRRQRSFLLGLPFSFAPGSVDGRAEYGAARLTADFVQRGTDQVFALSATGSAGLWGTRADNPLVLSPDRHFLALLVQFNFARRLAGNGLELRARATGQASSSVLYSAERLAVGGAESVRGYRETLLLADQGLVGSVELAQPFSLSGRRAGAAGFDWGAFVASAFADAGWVRNAEGPQPVPRTIASIGLSLAWQPSDAITASLAYGLALKAVDQTGSRDLQDRGLHFRLTFRPLRL